jgi:hypothetical protein
MSDFATHADWAYNDLEEQHRIADTIDEDRAGVHADQEG